jgi:hypothetical protein
MVVHPCIETEGMDASHTDELLARSREVIASAMPQELR